MSLACPRGVLDDACGSCCLAGARRRRSWRLRHSTDAGSGYVFGDAGKGRPRCCLHRQAAWMEHEPHPLEIELDGRPLVQLGFNEYTRIELRPGRHSVGAPDSFRTRATAGTPHAVQLTIEAGKTYYLLPSRWVENVRPTITMVGTTPVATTTADRHSSFTVQASLSSAAPPAAFLPLSFVAPPAN